MIPALHYRYKLLFFVFLNVADLFLAWQLWCQGDGEVLCEAHPIAYRCLTAYGWMVFVAFKCTVVLFVGVIFAIASRFRPRLGEGGLSLLCLALSSVVVYRACRAHMPSTPDQRVIHSPRKSEKAAPTKHPELESTERYNQLLRYWADQVAAERCTLAEAAQQVHRSKKGRDTRWLAKLHQSYGKDYSDEACFAISVLMHCAGRLLLEDDPSRARKRVASLQAEFKTLYGVDVPSVFKRKISLLQPACQGRPGIYPSYDDDLPTLTPISAETLHRELCCLPGIILRGVPYPTVQYA